MNRTKTFHVLGLAPRLWGVVIFLLGFLLYANTLSHDYTQDDAIVIYDNMFTQDGLSGLRGIFSKDTFFGFFKEEGKANLVSGGRYRPLSLVTFAIEWQIFGKNTFVGHLMNALLYALLCLLIFKSLLALDKKKSLLTLSFALVTTLIYTCHPIHTEAVANIKGRDEILCMLLSMASLYYGLKWFDQENKKHQILSAIALFLALLSKENAISFVAIIPMTIYFYRKSTFGQAIGKSLYLLIPALLFLAIRFGVLGFDFGAAPRELMNNPFIKIVNGSYIDFSFGEKLATIIFTIGKYFQLLFFPIQLTHDYYPRQIEVMSFANIKVILSTLMLLSSIALFFLGWRKKQIPSYGIFFFFASFALMSNLVFPIGTNMSERFMFMPSLGFAMILSYLLHWLFMRGNDVKKVMIASLVVCALYGFKTIQRNMDWKNDYVLFTTDVHKSPNSAKINNAAGGALTDAALKSKDENKKIALLQEAQIYLKRAIEIHPNYKNPQLILGNNYCILKDFANADKSYLNALILDPNFDLAIKNRAINYRDWGKNYGEQGNLEKATFYLKKAEEQLKDDYEVYRLLGTSFGMSGDHATAIKYFESAAKIGPKFEVTWQNLGKAYLNNGNEEKAQESFNKANQIKAESPTN